MGQHPRREPIDDLYVRAAGLPPLSRQRERELFAQRRTASPEERRRIEDILIRANIAFAADEAKRLSHRGPFLSLRRAAVRGLYEALQRYDETRGHKFISYAVWWIRQAMGLELASRRGLVKPSVVTVGHWRALGKAYGEATDAATMDQMLDAIGCRGDERAALLSYLFGPVYLHDRSAGTQDDLTVGDRLAAPEVPEDDGWTATMDDPVAVIDAALASIPPRLQRIVISYFGLRGEPALNLDQIGARIGVTRERVRQLRNKALDALRQAMLAGDSGDLKEEVDRMTSASDRARKLSRSPARRAPRRGRPAHNAVNALPEAN